MLLKQSGSLVVRGNLVDAEGKACHGEVLLL